MSLSTHQKHVADILGDFWIASINLDGISIPRRGASSELTWWIDALHEVTKVLLPEHDLTITVGPAQEGACEDGS